MKEPRTDKIRNIDKVAAALVVDPLATARKLAEETGIGASTANRARQELAQTGTKDPRILNLTDKDLSIVTRAQEIIEMKLNDEELVKDMNIRDISTVAKDSAARYSIFRGDATDKDGGLKAQIVQLPQRLDPTLE